MSARRRRSPTPSSSSRSSRSPSPVRIGRASSARLSLSTSSPRESQSVSVGASKQTGGSGSRIRRATPVGSRRSTGAITRRGANPIADDENSNSFESSGSSELSNQPPGRTRRRQVTINTNSQEIGGERRSTSRRLEVSSSGATEDDGRQLTWYERLMPECLLNWTAPLTGYERQLEAAELDDGEYEILERERLRRNRRVRRRLILMLAVASIASAYLFYRGRVPVRRPQGVRGTINEVAHRIEDGFSKTFHDTIGK